MTGLGFIHRFIPGDTAAAPTLLLLHGTGGNENDLLPLGRALNSNAALLSPRGKVLEHGMPRFFRRLAEGVFDLQDLTIRTHELAAFAETASTEYALRTDRLWAVGFSNGANIAASLLLLDPSLLADAILLRAMVPFEPETLPELSEKSVYIAAGLNDPIAPPNNTRLLSELLDRAGANVTLDWQPGGHSIGPEEIEAARAWLNLHLV